jgi:hypothetical protein
MLKPISSVLAGKFLHLLLIFLLGLFSFQPLAYASDMTPEQALSKIDLMAFGHEYPANSYSSALETLGDRCSTTSTHIADMSAVMTNNLLKNGRKFDNMSFLQQAVDATEAGNFGISCEEIFAMLTVLIQGKS